MSDVLRFESFIDVETIQPLNEEFSKAKCNVMYVDANRNGSFLKKEDVEKALPTIYNIPVVAEIVYKEGEKDYGTHGGKIVIDGNGISFEETTVPYGVVPESCNPRWEFVNDKEYLVCDIILWTGRYEDMDIILEDESGVRPQSMEIKILESYMDDDSQFEHITGFNFSALTILGKDVEPCFEDAEVRLYQVDNFKANFNKMLEAYSKLNKEGGRIEVDDKTKKDEFVNDDVATDTDVSSETVDIAGEEFVDKDADVKDDKVDEVEKFELSYRDKMQLLYEALPQSMEEETENGWKWQDTYIIDFTDSKVDYEVYGNMSGQYENKMFRASYTINENVATVDFESQEKLFRELVTESEKAKIDEERKMLVASLNEKITDLEGKVDEFEKANKELSEELETEKAFRLSIEEEERKQKIDETLDMFSKALENSEEFETIKENAYNSTVEEIEKECYVLIGKMNFSKSTKNTKKDKKDFSILSVEDKKEIDKNSSYEKIKEAYSKEV